VSVSETITDVEERKLSRAKRPRSAVTSGRKLFVEGDPNSAWSRRYHDLVQAHASDLGGRDTLSAAQLSLCKRAAALACELEQMEGRMSLGQQVDIDRFGRAASHLRRILEALGLERRSRDVTPTLSEYLAALRQSEAEANKPATEEGGASGMGTAHG
jgi:hypothetical protein